MLIANVKAGNKEITIVKLMFNILHEDSEVDEGSKIIAYTFRGFAVGWRIFSFSLKLAHVQSSSSQLSFFFAPVISSCSCNCEESRLLLRIQCAFVPQENWFFRHNWLEQERRYLAKTRTSRKFNLQLGGYIRKNNPQFSSPC